MSNALGSPVPSRERQELMNNSSNEVDPVVLHWREMFNKVFSTVRGWCGTYATEIKVDDGAQVQARAPKLWGFIADILYPGQFESGSSHAKHLLQEASSRPYLVERIMLQYIVNTMFSVDGWSDFREDVDHQLNILSERLHNTEREYNRICFSPYLRLQIYILTKTGYSQSSRRSSGRSSRTRSHP